MANIRGVEIYSSTTQNTQYQYTVKKIFSRFVITTFFILSNQLKSFI